MRRVASLIAKREGKKDETSIGNIREVLSNLTDIIAEESLKSDDGWSDTLAALQSSAEKKKHKLSLKKPKA